jgi:hypothetical protein
MALFVANRCHIPTEVLSAEGENRRARLVAELLASATCASSTERVQVFVAKGEGAGRRFLTAVVIYLSR